MRRIALTLTVLASALIPAATASATADPGHSWPAKPWPSVHTKGNTVEARGTSWEHQEGTNLETHVSGKLRTNKKNLCGWVRLEYQVVNVGTLNFKTRNCGSKWKKFHFTLDKDHVVYAAVQACEGTKRKPSKRCSPLRYLPGFIVESASDRNQS
ncbi:hypothetical protein Aph01nite_28670 [Acrocarpospora phusangensis]|uniref:DUF306 domain-containing protein n=1 Tax=Acrocarpospora phusangensis TaxID=1070424 RepID=A0A919UNJ2_9ACTN|nr:hypothetical protein [Acrocarpospora phusangensis]GIH24557.1 hypothetical protein Aph01nite_28670 [Acrocarpospora phusangensis]